MRSEIIRSKGNSKKENILRMSLNVGNNLGREQEKFMDIQDQQ